MAQSAKRPDTYESEFAAIDSLKPWSRNYRNHGVEQTGILAGSLRDFGQFKNIVVWRDFIVAGHGMIEAAKRRGYAEVEVKRLPDEWAESRVEAVLVADNEISRKATDDDEQLSDLLLSIHEHNAKLLDSVGWDRDELEYLLDSMESAQIGSVPSNDRNIKKEKNKQIKPVIFLSDLKVFEDAIVATGKKIRGEALMEVCRYYLENHEKGQLYTIREELA